MRADVVRGHSVRVGQERRTDQLVVGLGHLFFEARNEVVKIRWRSRSDTLGAIYSCRGRQRVQAGREQWLDRVVGDVVRGSQTQLPQRSTLLVAHFEALQRHELLVARAEVLFERAQVSCGDAEVDVGHDATVLLTRIARDEAHELTEFVGQYSATHSTVHARTRLDDLRLAAQIDYFGHDAVETHRQHFCESECQRGWVIDTCQRATYACSVQTGRDPARKSTRLAAALCTRHSAGRC